MLKWQWNAIRTVAQTVRGQYRIERWLTVWWASKREADGSYSVIDDESCPFQDHHDAARSCYRDASSGYRKRERNGALDEPPEEGQEGKQDEQAERQPEGACMKQIKSHGNPGSFTGRTTRHLVNKGLVTKDCSKVTAKGEKALAE